MPDTFPDVFLREPFARMRDIDLGVKLFGIFVISFIYIKKFLIRITSSKECRLVSTHEWITQSKIFSITSLLVIRSTWVMRWHDFVSFAFPATWANTDWQTLYNRWIIVEFQVRQVYKRRASLSNLNYRGPLYFSLSGYTQRFFCFEKSFRKSVVFIQFFPILQLSIVNYFVLNLSF